MSNHDCWKSEYDWEVSSRSKRKKETVLCVLFDNGAQRHFSSVRITLLCSNDVRSNAWHIKSQSSSLFVVNRVSSVAQDTPVTQNAASLPICNIVFMVDQHSDRSRFETQDASTKRCGKLVWTEASSPEDPGNTIFEFDQPLTENTQSVSVSFTSSYLLYTMMTHGVFTHPSADNSATVGRVVRVLPVTPMSKRRTISLPSDVLLPIFENTCFPLKRRGWRKDILSSALVCREWACALDMLLVDFRSRDGQQGHPPEIVGFANELVARPNLGLGIKYLSVRYLEKHPTWDPFPSTSNDPPSPEALAKRDLQRHDLYQAQFGNAFLSILRVAKNVQTLHLDPGIRLVVPPDDLADALRGLSKLEKFKGIRHLGVSMVQLVSCIAAWPSLKCLSIHDILPLGNHILPLASPSCCLTDLEITDIPIKDDELTCIVSASGATLERLTLIRISELTNVGLAAALNIVCTSLTYLWILCDELPRDQTEEHALDATITCMARLTTLYIYPHLASERMVERRAEAFLQQTTPALPEVDLMLIFQCWPRLCGLTRQLGRDWPGWKIGAFP